MKPAILFFASLLATVAIAQQPTEPNTNQVPPAASQPQSQPAEPPAKLVLKEGTDVKLKFAQALSSRLLRMTIP